MPYNKLLNDLINKSGLKQIEIVNKCKQMNVDITPSYLSILRKEEDRIPSEEISRAIAKICGAEDEDILVIEAYIDKAHPTILKAFNKLRELSYNTAISTLNIKLSDEDKEVLKARILQQSYAQIVIEMAKTNTDVNVVNGATTITADDGVLKSEISESIGFKVEDNSMYPILEKGNTVKIKYMNLDEYKDGDILCFRAKEGGKSLYRKCTFIKDDNSQFVAVPLNSKYNSEVISVEDVTIVGKVIECIKKL